MTFSELLMQVNDVFMAVWDMVIALLTFDQPILSIGTYLGIIGFAIGLYQRLVK